MNLSEFFEAVSKLVHNYTLVGQGIAVFFFGVAAYSGFSIAKRLEAPILYGGFFLALVVCSGIAQQHPLIELFTNPGLLILGGLLIGAGYQVYRKLVSFS